MAFGCGLLGSHWEFVFIGSTKNFARFISLFQWILHCLAFCHVCPKTCVVNSWLLLRLAVYACLLQAHFHSSRALELMDLHEILDPTEVPISPTFTSSYPLTSPSQTSSHSLLHHPHHTPDHTDSLPLHSHLHSHSLKLPPRDSPPSPHPKA